MSQLALRRTLWGPRVYKAVSQFQVLSVLSFTNDLSDLILGDSGSGCCVTEI